MFDFGVIVAANPVTGAYPDPLTPLVVVNISLLETDTTCITPPPPPVVAQQQFSNQNPKQGDDLV